MSSGPISDFGLRYAIGLTNWGGSPFYGATKLGGAYALNTTLSSHSLEGIYSVGIVTPHRQKWVFGAGLGYESDVYKFANEYVDFSDPGDGSAAFFCRNGSHRRLVYAFCGPLYHGAVAC